MNTKKIKWNKVGTFYIKNTFIHIKLLTGEFAQGLVISGATALAGAPVARHLV